MESLVVRIREHDSLENLIRLVELLLRRRRNFGSHLRRKKKGGWVGVGKEREGRRA